MGANRLHSGSAPSVQVGGDHYKRPHPHEPIDVMRTWLTADEFRGFLRGNVLKYVARDKGDRATDLRKARQYLDWLIEAEESRS